MRGDHGRADFDGAGDAERDGAPESHVFVRGRGVPVDPVDAEIFFGLGNGFDGKDVRRSAWSKLRRDVEFVDAVRAGDFTRVGDFFAVEPNVGAVVDAGKTQPDVAAVRSIGRGEFGAIPPGAAEWAVLGHGLKREHFVLAIVHTGKFREVVAEIRIGIGFVGDECCDDGRRHRGFVPALGAKARDRNLRPGRGDFAGGLESPMVAEVDASGCSRGLGKRSRGCG